VEEGEEVSKQLYVLGPILDDLSAYDPTPHHPATEADILAQPCVVAALKKVQDESDHWRHSFHQLAPTWPAWVETEEILAQPCVVEALQRAHDLVRHQRGALYDEGLITDEEYALLAGEHGAVARLEGYDTVRKALADARTAWEREQSDDATLVRAVAGRLRANGAEVPSPLAEAEDAYLLTHPVVVAALGRAREVVAADLRARAEAIPTHRGYPLAVDARVPLLEAANDIERATRKEPK
jgi:hypothetical protein